MKSIEKQLNLSLAINIVVIFFLFWLVSVITIHKVTERFQINHLELATNGLQKYLSQTEHGWQMATSEINIAFRQMHSGFYYVIQTPSNTLVSPSLAGYPLFLKNSHDPLSVYDTKGPHNSTVIVRRETRQLNGHPITFYVTEDHSPIQQTLRVFDIVIGLFALMTLGLLYWSQKRLLRKGFRQLDPIHHALDAMQQGQATHRTKLSRLSKETKGHRHRKN